MFDFWQATLGLDCKGKERTVVKCKVGDNPELLLCSLIPGVSESCALDLLFDQEVTFTVSGATSVHLTGYYMPLEEPYSSEDDEDEYDSYPLKKPLIMLQKCFVMSCCKSLTISMPSDCYHFVAPSDH